MDSQITKNVLGLRIMQRRKQLNIKQSELAKMLNISDKQISNIENGKSFPKLNNFILLCNILKCNSDYFLSGILKTTVKENISDLVAMLSIEEQETLWQLLDCYIHQK